MTSPRWNWVIAGPDELAQGEHAAEVAQRALTGRRADRVDHHDVARPEPVGLHDLGRVEREEADLRRGRLLERLRERLEAALDVLGAPVLALREGREGALDAARIGDDQPLQASARAGDLPGLDEHVAEPARHLPRPLGAEVGERALGRAPNGHWKTTTFLAGLAAQGLIAPCVFDGPINGEAFRAYVEHMLVPELKPGDVVILDNLSSHKNQEAARLIAAAGARLLFLPPYSPDLNPIELMFAKLKQLLRRAQARTVEALYAAIGRLIEEITPSECANYIRHCGYASV